MRRILIFALLLLMNPIPSRGQTASDTAASTAQTDIIPLTPETLSPAALAGLQELPILYSGRVRPFISFTSDAVLEITGKRKWQKQAPSATVLHWIALPESAYVEPLVPVPYEPLRVAVSLPGDHDSRFSMHDLLSNQELRSVAIEAFDAESEGRELTLKQDKAIELMNRLGMLQEILTHEGLRFVPNRLDPSSGWLPPQALVGDSSRSAYRVALAYTGLIEAYRRGNVEIVETALRQLHDDLAEWHGEQEMPSERLAIETLYRRANPWNWARVLYLVTLLAALLSVWVKPETLTKFARRSLLLGFLIHTAGLALRWYIGSRAPWSNMYESLITLTWGALLLAQFPMKGAGGRIVIPIAAVIGFANLTIAAHPSLNPAIDPLVPALKSVWLNIHVIVILLGYSAGTLAMGAGHAWLFMDTFRPESRKTMMSISHALYRFVQYAVLFLIVGILLGSIWAHAAWGRYWGWDPKETWALITWLFYLGLIHASGKGYLRERGMAISSLIGFLLVLMTYYGVNYYLAGLHSYAKGEALGIPLSVVLFVVVELVVLLGYFIVQWRRSVLASEHS
jgi:cytochrome c-type biogenesis protein CcsB